MITNQAILFLVFIIIGIIIGFLFDIFRILRKTFNTPDVITYVEDIIFWILTGIITLYAIFYFNNGEIRLFMFLAIILGCIIYMILLSKYIVNISVKVLNFILKIIKKFIKIATMPIIFIITYFKKIFFKPFSFIIINFKKIFKNLINKVKNIFKTSQHKKTFYTKKT